MPKILADFSYPSLGALEGAKPRSGTGFIANPILAESPIDPIPDRLCPRCQRWTEGRPWGGSSKLYGYGCACGHQWVETSPCVKAARERVREARKQRGGR